MDAIDSELIGQVLGHSTTENVFRPWWDWVEDVLIYALLMLGLLVVPTAMVMGSPLQCTLKSLSCNIAIAWLMAHFNPFIAFLQRKFSRRTKF